MTVYIELMKYNLPDTSNSPLLENSIAFTHPKWHTKSRRYKFFAAMSRLWNKWDFRSGRSPYSLLFRYGNGFDIFAMFRPKPPFSDTNETKLLRRRSAVFLFLKHSYVPIQVLILKVKL